VQRSQRCNGAEVSIGEGQGEAGVYLRLFGRTASSWLTVTSMRSRSVVGPRTMRMQRTRWGKRSDDVKREPEAGQGRASRGGRRGLKGKQLGLDGYPSLAWVSQARADGNGAFESGRPRRSGCGGGRIGETAGYRTELCRGGRELQQGQQGWVDRQWLRRSGLDAVLHSTLAALSFKERLDWQGSRAQSAIRSTGQPARVVVRGASRLASSAAAVSW